MTDNPEHRQPAFDSMRPTAGQRFGPYRLIEKLGDGGFAEIFVATHLDEGRQCVLKLLHEHLHQHKVTLDMFLTEAKVMMALEHPAIVHFNDLKQQEGRWYIDMEWVEGADLAEVFDLAQDANVPLPVPVAVKLIQTVASAVHHAHERVDPSSGAAIQIIHRDLKPDNLLLTWDGDVKVTDFGCAKAVGIQEELTRPGIRKGTLDYMSPEQCLGRQVDCRTDVFSLGVVLYELVTMSRLFADESDARVIDRIVHETVTPPSYLNQEVNAALDLIILRALEKSPSERFASASELERALKWWLVRYSVEAEDSALSAWLKTHIQGELARFRAVDMSAEGVRGHGEMMLRAPSQSPRARTSRRSEQTSRQSSEVSQQLVRTNLQHTGEVLVGREELLQQLRLSIKSGHRTVSLFGRHGNGKSAIARRLALEMLAGSPPIPGGVWWVDLEEVNDLLRVPELIAKAMKLSRTDASSQVKELDEVFAIRGRTLLVLDGVDDVSGDVLQLISHWTTSCPEVTFIVTCQQELVRPDVHSCYVGALHVPNDPRKLPMSAAGELFSTIVRRHRPGFVLRARHLQRLHELLMELRGSPAAIEVLAQRMLTGDLEQELVSADEGPVALGIDRDTIATALELTWEQLDVDERAVLALSSAFHGGLTQHALLRVAGSFVSEEELTAALDSLSERLLLRLQFPDDARTDPRYWLADSVRQRSRRTLMDSGRQSLIHHMHIQYFLNNAESLAEAFESQYGDSAVMQFRDELLNVEAALNRSLRKLPVSPTRAVIACRLLNVLWAYANLRSKYATFLDLGLRVKELITGVDIDPGLRARLLLHLCEASLASGEADVARECVEEAQALSVSNPDTEIATWVALQSALVCVEAGDWNDAEAFVEVATGPLREVNEEQGLVLAWRTLAKIYFGTSRYEQSVSMVDKAISVIADAGATHLLATLQLQQGSALLKLERLAPALRCLEAAAQTFERFMDRPRLVRTLLEIAEYHRLSGDLSTGLAICEDAQQFANRHGGLELNQAVVQQIRQMQAVRSSVRRVSLPADVLEDSFAVTMKWIQNEDGGA